MISNYGRLWHKYQQAFLAINIDSKGYPFKPLATNHGPQNVRIHRLVLMTFAYFPGCENVMINHIDGNKCNPAIWNLEWSSYSDNQAHAWKTGLMKRTNRPISDETVHNICQDIEDGILTAPQIAFKYGVARHDIDSIVNHRAYTDISSLYHFKRRKGVMSDDKIRQMCFFYSTHPRNGKLKNDYLTEALQYINVEITANTLNVAERVLYKQSFKSISKDYNF